VKQDVKREIMSLALLLEDISDLTVFVDYYGHVNEVSVRVYENYESERKELFNQSFYTYHSWSSSGNYQDIKTFLQTKIEEYTAIK
jgi:hypothetical protein